MLFTRDLIGDSQVVIHKLQKKTSSNSASNSTTVTRAIIQPTDKDYA